jgi:hypothetical protein
MSINVEPGNKNNILVEKRNKIFLELRNQLGLREMKVRNLRDDDVVLIANPEDPTQLLFGVYRSGGLQAFSPTGFREAIKLNLADEAYYAGHHDYFEESTKEPDPNEYEGLPGWWELIHDDLVAEVIGGDKPDLAIENVHMPSSVHPDDILLLAQNGLLVLQLATELRLQDAPTKEQFAEARNLQFPVDRIRMFEFDGESYNRF